MHHQLPNLGLRKSLASKASPDENSDSMPLLELLLRSPVPLGRPIRLFVNTEPLNGAFACFAKTFG